MSVIESDLNRKVADTMIFKCEVCFITFKSKEYLTMHQARHITNGHTHKHKVECPQCKKRFANNRGLKRHVNESHDKMKQNCHKCEKTFARKDTLKNHVKLEHDKIENFKCATCGKCFAMASVLKNHTVRVTKSFAKFVHLISLKPLLCMENYVSDHSYQ